jgi:carbamoyl-phosphate synthase large subunit
MIFPVKRLADLGFTLIATTGTAEVLRRNGITATVVRKVSERGTTAAQAGTAGAAEPSIVDLILGGEISMVVNTPSGPNARADGYAIRAATTSMDKPIITTVQELAAAVQGIEAQLHGELRVKPLQEHARDLDLYGREVRA